MAPVGRGEQYQDRGEMYIAKEDVEWEEYQGQYILERTPASDVLKYFIKVFDFIFFIFVVSLHFTRSGDCCAMFVIG